MTPDRETGSTTLEALAAVVILAAAGAAALGAAGPGMDAWKECVETSAAAALALGVDDALRSAALEVRVPWWERGALLEGGEKSMRMSYWRGLKKESWTITARDGGLFLATPESSRFFRGVRLIHAGPAPDDGSPPRGSRVDYRIDGRLYSTTAGFGGWALGKAFP